MAFNLAADVGAFHSTFVEKEQQFATALRRTAEARAAVERGEAAVTKLEDEKREEDGKALMVLNKLDGLEKHLDGVKTLQDAIMENLEKARAAGHKAKAAEAAERAVRLAVAIEALKKGIAEKRAQAEAAVRARGQERRRRRAARGAKGEKAEAVKGAEEATGAWVAKQKELEAGLEEEEKVVREKRDENAAMEVGVEQCGKAAQRAREAAAKARVAAGKVVGDAKAAAEEKTAKARKDLEVATGALKRVQEERAEIQRGTTGADEKRAEVEKELPPLAAKRAQEEAKLQKEKEAVAAARKLKEEMQARLVKAEEARDDNREYHTGEMDKLEAARREREAAQAALQRRLAEAEAGLAQHEARARWLARVGAVVGKGGAGVVDVGEGEGEEAVPEVREAFARRAKVEGALAAVRGERAGKAARVAVLEEGGGADDESEGEGEEEGGMDAELAAGERALATLEARERVQAAAWKVAAARGVLAGEEKEDDEEGVDEGEEEEEEARRGSVGGGVETRRASGVGERKVVRFSEPLNNRAENERLAAHRVACEARWQQAVAALEVELAALDKAMAKQEEAAERAVAAEAAGVEEALAVVREEKAAVLRKLKQLEA